MANDWFYSNQGQQKGPVSLDVLRQMKASGQLTLTDMVWHNGLPEWIRAHEAPELATVSAPAPSQMPAPAPMPVGALSYQSSPQSGEITLTARAFDMLRATKPWVRLMSIVMWAVAGFMLIGGAGMLVLGTMSQTRSAGVPAAMGVVYMAFAFIYIAPAIYLYRYASRIADLLLQRRDGNLEAALAAQKSFWKFAGIMTLIVIGIYGLIFIAAVLIGVLR